MNCSFIQSTLIKIPFTKEEPSRQTNIFEKYFKSYISLNLGLGTPNQDFKVYLNQSSYFFWVADKKSSYNNIIDTFDSSKSSTVDGSLTFESKINEPQLIKGLKMGDVLTINNIDYGMQSFISGTELIGLDQNSGVIGLDIGNKITGMEEEYNFIQCMKNKGNITNFSYTIQFDGNSKGLFIIGEYPHERKDSQWFQTKESFKPFNTLSYERIVKWGLGMQYAQGFKDIQFEKGTSGVFSVETGFIIGSKAYYNNVYEYFFKSAIEKGLCEKHSYEDDYQKFYTYFTCNDKISLKSFTPLIFFIETNIVYKFKAEELFIYDKKFSQYMFMVVFKENDPYTDYWVFGDIFLKKYEIVFDQNRKIIGAYHYEKVSKKSNKTMILFIIIILVLGIAAFVYFYFSMKKRTLKINFEGEFSQLKFTS